MSCMRRARDQRVRSGNATRDEAGAPARPRRRRHRAGPAIPRPRPRRTARPLPPRRPPGRRQAARRRRHDPRRRLGRRRQGGGARVQHRHHPRQGRLRLRQHQLHPGADGRRWPTNLLDCKNAVRFLRKHASAYHVDPDRIGVIGGSAGGHLAAHGRVHRRRPRPRTDVALPRRLEPRRRGRGPLRHHQPPHAPQDRRRGQPPRRMGREDRPAHGDAHRRPRPLAARPRPSPTSRRIRRRR